MRQFIVLQEYFEERKMSIKEESNENKSHLF